VLAGAKVAKAAPKPKPKIKTKARAKAKVARPLSATQPDPLQMPPMDRKWWPDGTETSSRHVAGSRGDRRLRLRPLPGPKTLSYAWAVQSPGSPGVYSPPKLDSLGKTSPQRRRTGFCGDEAKPGGSHPLFLSDMNDSLQIGSWAATTGVPGHPDVGRPIQIEISKVKAFFDAKS